MSMTVGNTLLRNAVLLILLSIQVGIQPILMKRYAKDTTSVRLRVGVIEGLKWILAVVFLAFSGSFQSIVTNWQWKKCLKTTVLPSLIYILQNYLNQTAVVVLDGVTYNILNQTKILWTAILVYWMLGKRQSKFQIVALIGLILGAILMTTSSAKSSTFKPNESSMYQNLDPIVYLGIIRALVAAMLSGVAGTIIQKALQVEKRNAYMVTIELSLIGIFTLIGSSLVSYLSENKTIENSKESIWKGWHIGTWLAMFTQAIGGIIVGFVIKFCGNVEKSFAVVAGLLLTAFLESFWNRKPFGIEGYGAVFIVSLSTFIYTKYPYSPPFNETSKNSMIERTRNEMEMDKVIGKKVRTHSSDSPIRQKKRLQNQDKSSDYEEEMGKLPLLNGLQASSPPLSSIRIHEK